MVTLLLDPLVIKKNNEILYLKDIKSNTIDLVKKFIISLKNDKLFTIVGYITVVAGIIAFLIYITNFLKNMMISSKVSLPQTNVDNSINNDSNFFDDIKLIISNIKPYIDRLTISILQLGNNSKSGLLTLISNGWVSNIKPSIDRLKTSISQFRFNNKFKKEDIAKLGLFTLMSYGWVSNVSYITCLIISWIIHGKEYNLSPLAPGQWKFFLTIYAALWAANNVLRPFRVTFALFLAPYFEKWVDNVEKRTNFKRATATAIVIFLFNICGTVSYLVGGLVLATKIAGVPLLP